MEKIHSIRYGDKLLVAIPRSFLKYYSDVISIKGGNFLEIKVLDEILNKHWGYLRNTYDVKDMDSEGAIVCSIFKKAGIGICDYRYRFSNYCSKKVEFETNILLKLFKAFLAIHKEATQEAIEPEISIKSY